jgi:hypothetical protein
MGAQQCFRCASPRCGIDSCVDRGRVWAPFHDSGCEVSERLHIERAMSEAVKHTVRRAPYCPCAVTLTPRAVPHVVREDRRVEQAHVPVRVRDVLRVPRGHARGAVRAHFGMVLGMPCRECVRCSLYAAEDEHEKEKDRCTFIHPGYPACVREGDRRGSLVRDVRTSVL